MTNQRTLSRTARFTAAARSGHGVALKPLALLIGSMLSAGMAQANPTGGQVVAGSASLTPGAPGTLNIRQASDRAVINWQGFSIGAGETVNFLQPATSSVVLNRVLGNDPSALFGQLNANGTVMLVNPNGIVFGRGSRVDVGGLVATTANVRDTDFMAGRHAFTQASPKAQASVVNEGQISIHDSGLAALVAPSVRNAGVIEAKLGRVALGGAASFTLDFQGDGLLSFNAGSAVTAAQTQGALVLNSGEIRADGGVVQLSAQAVKGVIDNVINTTGLISATSVGSHNGRIVLSGGAAGQVTVAGTLDASGRAPGQTGGTVVTTGEQVRVLSGARMDASGAAAGGEIALGSAGRAAPGELSQRVQVDAGAVLIADATQQGQGGVITVWSKDQTVFAGQLSARGGAQGGDGGFAEISSHKNIGLTGTVDLRAAQGQTGLLLLDPTDLRITDAASGGSQDSNATDTSVAAADANQGSGNSLNTVSRGLLESLSGTANIVLQATGQITVDAMAGGLINLATTAGHSVSLQSTQSGGIRFVDASTEIRTQGGAITLEALGLGSTLSNIGKLSSNGGAITLRATGDIVLAGALNAGSGVVSLQSTVGSIANAVATAPRLSGSAVSLSAPGGHIGVAGQAIATHTAALTLESGGHAVASSDLALTDLTISAAHVAPTTANDYLVSAPGLTFQLGDGSALGVTQITQSPGLNFSLTADRSLQLGSVNVGTGTLTLASSGGNLLGASGTNLSAGTLHLSAQGSNGNNGAIGSLSQALFTSAGQLEATAGSGGVYLANTGALALNRLSSSGNANLTATGSLTAGDVNVGNATLALGSSTGSVLDDGNAATRLTASSLQLSAGGAIGSASTRLDTSASSISANAAAGGIYASTSSTYSTWSSVISGNGAIDLRTAGSATLTSLSSSTSAVANGITVTAAGPASFTVGSINAGTLGGVTLTTPDGSIYSSGTLTGDTVTLHAGGNGGVSARTAASHLDVVSDTGFIGLTQTGAVTLDRLSTDGTYVSVTNSSGNITVGSIRTALSGQVQLSASAGAVFDDGNSATRLRSGTAVLSASGAIGAPGQAVQTQVTTLSASSTGDLVIRNTDATLTSLSLTNRHSAPGNAATLQVDSPYLTFDVTDTGTSYTLDHLVGVPLSDLTFNGDQTLVLGQVQATGTVSLISTLGHLQDDGNLNTRVTSGGALTLRATQGSVGSLANPLVVNATSLGVNTRGDLYLSDITDLTNLTLVSNHADSNSVHGLSITAPSLKFDVSDSATGHTVNTLTDTSSLVLSYTSDRDITLGRVDLTRAGTATFTSSNGAIKDDGDKTTRVLAGSTTFSGRGVGASGANHLDVITGSLMATAGTGGLYVELPTSSGAANTTGTIMLGPISSTGPVTISALEGDLSLGTYFSVSNQAVSLSAAQGAILSPNSQSIALGSGSLTLNALNIGASDKPLWVSSSAGSSLQAQAGSAMFINGSSALTLSSLDAGSAINYTQSSGAITVGHVDAGVSGSVTLTASNGSILNDSNPATGLRAQQVTLNATQGIGNSTALAVDAPQLWVTANGQVNLADSATLSSLSLTRGSGSSGSMAITAGAGQNFVISEDGTAHTLGTVTSTTPLAFSFAGQRDVKIGLIDVGSAGSASISSTTQLVNDGAVGSHIDAGTVSLTAGTSGSIGATGSGNGLSLEGTTALTLSAGRNFFVSSDSALTDLTLTSTNSTTAAGTASVFELSSLGQTYAITDSGTTQSLSLGGTALTNFSLSSRKNLSLGTIEATGDVTLSTSGGGVNSNISSASGTGRVAGNRVLLTAISSTAGGGSIGTSGSALRVDTPTVILNGSANVYVDDAQNLTQLDMTLTHGTNTTFGYGVTAGNFNSFSLSDGSTQSLGMAVNGAIDFSYSVDRALSLSVIDAGTSTSGSVSLTSRSAPSGTSPQINRSTGTIIGGRISLSAVGTNGGVGAGATLSTNTQNLSIASGGNVSVSNAATLQSLSLDAQHRSGGGTHSYSLSSTGLTFSLSDSTSTPGLQLSNISQSGLDLSIKSDRTLTVASVNTGAGGKVKLQSSSIRGGSGANVGSPSITTGDLVLSGGVASSSTSGVPLYTAATTLASTLTGALMLSNAGNLTLLTNTVGGNATVTTTSGSLLQGTGGLFTASTLRLNATQSLGSSGTLQTNTRDLTLVAGAHIDVGNAVDLYTLNVTSTHATPGSQNLLSVTAPRLTLALADSVSGNLYHLSNLVDSSGLDLNFSTDVALSLGTVNVQAGRNLSLTTTGSNRAITNDGSSLLQAGSLTLTATGSVGAAGGSSTRMQTNAQNLSLITRGNAYADNAQALSSLSLTSTQPTGGSAPVYQVTAPAMTFDITDDGTTHLNQVVGSGLNFVLSTQRNQAIGVVDVGRSGRVSLSSQGDILGDADSSRRLHAANVTLAAGAGGAVGSLANPVRLSAPLTSFQVTGALNVESDTHIDRLEIATTHPTVGYGGTYSVVSTPITGAAYSLLTATDSVTGTALTSLNDPLGLAFSFNSDHAIQVGTLNLGSTGTVSLTTNAAIQGDGNPTTKVSAASLALYSPSASVGASGSGNSIDATVNMLTAAANGTLNLALHGPTTLGNIVVGSGVVISNDDGDIALGAMEVNGGTVSINNQGGSILSGTLMGTSTVSLTASGSIGNQSALSTTASGGGTTTLTVSASAAHGASGSVAINEAYSLMASSITGPAGVTLSSAEGLLVGTISSSAGALSLTSTAGSINGISGNALSGTRVTLSATNGSSRSLGNSEVRLNVNTPQLVLNTPGSVYVTDSADLNLLTLDRSTASGNSSGGTLSVIASGLSFSASDSAGTTTLTTLSDSTGLDFSYLGIGSLSVGSLNVGAAGVMRLEASPASGNGHIQAINNSALITAGSLTLQAGGTASRIGSSATPLRLAVGSLTATSGSGGMELRQAGSLNLLSLSTQGNMNVIASSGDLTLGTLSYGEDKTLSLSASVGRILSGGGTLTGGSADASISLSAANGIGTAAAPILVSASAGHTVAATVTGSGSLYLSSLSTLQGGLTTNVHDGATRVTSAGAITLTDMQSGTDRAGNDIAVTASSGDITAMSVSGGSGARFNAIDLSANGGRLLAAPGATLEGFDVQLYGATGVGTSSDRVAANGQRVQVGSAGGAIYLSAAAPSVLSSVVSVGGLINISHSDHLLLANALSSGGAITVSSTAANVQLMAGNVNAGNGTVTLSATGNGARLLDDGNRDTWVSGSAVGLTGAGGVGTAQQSLQTSTATLSASSGNGIYLEDHRSAGVTLASVIASGGAVSVSSMGPTLATLVQATADVSGNNVLLSTTSGDLTVASVSAGSTNGAVQLSAAGSLLGSGNGTLVTAHSAQLSAGADIGVVTNLTTGAGTPFKVNVASLTGLSSTGANRVVSVLSSSNSPFILGNNVLSLGTGSSAYLSTAGDLDASAGIALATGNLSLTAGGTLLLPLSAISTTGAVRLTGSTDVRTNDEGVAARHLHVNANSLVLRSGAAGGDTQLTTAVGSLDAALSGSGDLSVSNTGTLSATTLATSNGDISATNSAGMTAGSVVAGGSNRSISLIATAGDLSVGTVNAGSNGSVTLSAAQGALSGASATLTASTLNLTSGTGIGSSGAAFGTNAANVSAQVTGVGGIYLGASSALTLGALSTHDGDIAVTSAGHLSAGAITAGQSGNVSLTSTGGNVTLSQAYTQTGSDASRAGLSLQGQAVSVGAVSTTGAQSYTGALTVGGDLSGASIQVTGPVTLGGGASQTFTGDLHITGTLVGEGQALTLNAGNGAVVLGGAASGLASLTASAASLQVASVSTSGAQSYQGATTLNGNYTTQGGAFGVTGAALLGGATSIVTGGGQASFGGTLNGASALTLSTGAGDALFSGAVGQSARLGAVAITSAGLTRFNGAVAAGSLVTDAAGTLAVNGGSVNTTGAQSYGEHLVMGSDTVLTGSLLTLSQGADATTAGQQGLTLTGPAVLGGALGAQAALKSLVISGAAALNGGSITTSGAQAYGGAVILGVNTQLSGIGIAFDSSLNGAADLTVQAGNGAAQFTGAVGTTTRLGAVVVNSGGATRFGAAVKAASLSTDATGTLALDGGTVHTTGAQSYGERAVLGNDTTLTGSSLSLTAGADASGAGGQSLTLVGPATLAGAFGAQQALGSLSVTGLSVLGAGSITTTGAQSYVGATYLAGDLVLSGQGISFAGSMDGSAALSVHSGSGNAWFGGALGSEARLGAVSVSSSGLTQFDGSIRAASLSTDAAGTLTLNGGSVHTTGAQSYGENLVLGANTTLTGSALSLTGGADALTAGGQSLTLVGDATLAGAFGAQQALSALSISGSSTLAAGAITTTGDQTYRSALLLTGDQTLTTHTGRISLGGTLDGGHVLSIDNAASDFSFTHAVGSNARLGALTVLSSGATRFDAAVRAASVSTDAAGTVALNGGTVDTTGTQSYGEHVMLGADTTLTASHVHLLGGVDAAETGSASLVIQGAASVAGSAGAQQALRLLTVSGDTTLGAGSVTTTGAQSYAGAVTVTGDQALSGSALSIANTLDSTLSANLSLAALTGAVEIGGNVGDRGLLGALTLRAGTTNRLGGALSANDLQLSAQSHRFDGAVTARTGAVALTNTEANGTTVFARNAAVQAATGFTQTGGASMVLPASIQVTHGGIMLEAPASLPTGSASITADGAIRLSGLVGANTELILNAGTGQRGTSQTGQPTWRAFDMEIGSNDAYADHKINVANLAVTTASAAKLYGTVRGKTGALAASHIDSALVNAPYFINDTPWGPLEVINRLVATTVPLGVVPSTPGVTPLFTGVVDRNGVQPNVLGIYASPQVLTVVPLGPIVLTVPRPTAPNLPTTTGPTTGPTSGDDATRPEDTPR